MHRTDAAPFSLSAIWHNRSLRWGIVVAGVLGVSLLTMFGLMYWRSSVLLFDTLDRSVIEQLQLLSARPPELLPFMIQSRMNQQPDVMTQVGLFDRAGHPLVGNIGLMPEGLVLDGRIRQVMSPNLPIEHWRAAGRTLPNQTILVVARSADEILEVRQRLVNGAIVGIVPAILLSLAGGAWAGLATERRLRRLNAVAERIIAGDLRARLPTRSGGDELDRLCTIFNRILDRLEEGVDALRGVGENIAHDLRTPLTALRARLERSAASAGPETPEAQSIGKSMGNVDRALSIITALLRISEIENVRRASGFARVDLMEILQETAETFLPVAEEKGIRLTATIQTEAVVVGDRQLLIEALVNLVDNAVKFTPAGGSVELRLCGTPAAPVLIVSDNGPGITPAARAHVFQRFYRADGARTTPGSGLGLSLVAAVAKFHRYALRIDDNQPGCSITLRCWRDSDSNAA
jgi:signal transduction histidine kinase